MLLGYEQTIKALMRSHCWVKVLKQLKFLARHLDFRKALLVATKESVCFLDQGRQRVLRIGVKFALGQIKNTFRYIRKIVCFFFRD